MERFSRPNYGIVKLWVTERVGSDNYSTGKVKVMSDCIDNGIGAHVIELTGFRDAGVRPALAQVEAYWDQVRGQRLVPSRAEIDPKGLEGALRQVFVLERIAKGLARFRIAGAHLTELMGLEVRGMPLSAIFQPEAREPLSDAIEAVFDDPAVVRLELDAQTGFGRPAIRGDMILMPLRSDLGEVSRILGAVVMAGDIGRAPRRLGITNKLHRGLTGYADGSALPARGNSELDERGTEAIRPTENILNGTTTREISASHYLKLVADNTVVD